MNIAEQIWRFQDRIYFKHRHTLRLISHWFRRCARILWVPLISLGLILLVVEGSEKLIQMPVEQRWPLDDLLPLARWINGQVSLDTLSTGLEHVFSWLFSQWLVGILTMVAVVVALATGCLFLIWPIPKFIATYQDKKSVRRLGVLRTAVRPVPSRQEMTVRFIVVFIVVWLGLHIFQVLSRWLGYCLLAVNDECENKAVTEFVWVSLAALGALLSLWNMYQARINRAAARRHLKRPRH